MLSFGTESQQDKLGSRNGSEMSKKHSQSNFLDFQPKSRIETARHSQLSHQPNLHENA